MPPDLSQVATPVTEQMSGVVEVTSSKCPRDFNPEFCPVAKRVDAANIPFDFAFIDTADAEYKVPDLEVESE